MGTPEPAAKPVEPKPVTTAATLSAAVPATAPVVPSTNAIANATSLAATHVAAPTAKSFVQLSEYPSPNIRGPMPQNAHPDSTFSSHVHNDWTYVQLGNIHSPISEVQCQKMLTQMAPSLA